MLDTLGESFREQVPALFKFAIETYAARTSRLPKTSFNDRARALDAWNMVARVLMEASLVRVMPAYRVVYDYMRACEAPLPTSYSSARRARMRMNQAVAHAREAHGRMSRRRRLRCLDVYPLSGMMLRRYGSPAERLKRAPDRQPS